MAFLTSRRTSGVSVRNGFDLADGLAINIKAQAVACRAAAAAGTLSTQHLVNVQTILANARLQFISLENQPVLVEGVPAYAATQFADVINYNFGANYSAMRTQIDSVLTFLVTNWPKTSDGTPIIVTGFDANGVSIWYSGFSQAARNAVIANLDPLIAAID